MNNDDLEKIRDAVKSELKGNTIKEFLLIFVTSFLGVFAAIIIESYTTSSAHKDKLDSMYKAELLKEYKNTSKIFSKISSVYLYQNENIVKNRDDLVPLKQEVVESLSNLQNLISNKKQYEEVTSFKRQSVALVDDIFNTKLAVQLCDRGDSISKQVCNSTLTLRNLRLTVSQCHFCKLQKSIFSLIGRAGHDLDCDKDYKKFKEDISKLEDEKLRESLEDEIKKSIEVYQLTPPYAC